MTDAIVALGSECGDGIAALGGSPGLLAQPAVDAFGMVARDKSLSAFIMVQIAADEADIVDIAVRTDRRRRGLATALLTDTLNRLRARGVRLVHLEVDEANDPARHLYQAAGFDITGQRPGYYRKNDGTRTDALVMALALDAASGNP